MSGTRILAGTNGPIYSNSLDSLAVWNVVPRGAVSANCFLSNDRYVYTGTGYNGILRSTDTADTWIECNSGLTSTCILCLDARGDTLIAGSLFDGVFVSTNSGDSWAAINSGLTESGTLHVNAVLIAGDQVLVGNAQGIWRRPLAEIVTAVSMEPSYTPAGSMLKPNFPNPFNPSTSLEFTILQKEHVSLVIYNLLGVTIKTVVDEQLEAGLYTRKWDATGLASGIYICRLVVGRQTESRTLVFVR